MVVALLLDDKNRVLIAKRPRGKSFAGYWEFPGGKVEHNEHQLSALRRELNEELGLDLNESCFEALDYAEYRREKSILALDFFICRCGQVHVEGREGQELRWIDIADISSYRFPKANDAVIAKLRRYVCSFESDEGA